MSNPSKLLNVPRDVIHLIAEELYRSDHKAFKNFRLVSKACRDEAEYFFFRTVTLSDSTDSAQAISSEVIKRLIDDKNDFGSYVRHLKIGPVLDEPWFYFEIYPSLQVAIRNITKLQSLTWHTHQSPGANFPKVLHDMHPSARLCVHYRNRNFAQMDCTLLSSPQLYSLKIPVYHSTDGSEGSELQDLKRCLIEGNSVRSLHLRFASCSLLYNEAAMRVTRRLIDGPCNFHWKKGDQFPALEELSIEYGGGSYLLTPDNCKMWTQVMDWSCLRKLDLERGTPRDLLLALTGRVPNLQNLKCGIWAAHAQHATWELHPLSTGLPVLSAFLASLTVLSELSFEAYAYNDFMAALPLMLQHHGSHLKRLDISCREYLMKPWVIEQYLDVLEKAPNLSYLKAHIEQGLLVGTWPGEEATALSAREKFESAVKNDKVVEQPKSGKKKGKKWTSFAGRADNRHLEFLYR